MRPRLPVELLRSQDRWQSQGEEEKEEEARDLKVKVWMRPFLTRAQPLFEVGLELQRKEAAGLLVVGCNRERAQRRGAGLTSSSPWSCGGMFSQSHSHTETLVLSFSFNGGFTGL